MESIATVLEIEVNSPVYVNGSEEIIEPTYTLADLVSFGNYLLSEERTNRIVNHSSEQIKERLSEVHDADIANFMKK